jgi:hypothetical protein
MHVVPPPIPSAPRDKNFLALKFLIKQDVVRHFFILNFCTQKNTGTVKVCGVQLNLFFFIDKKLDI